MKMKTELTILFLLLVFISVSAQEIKSESNSNSTIVSKKVSENKNIVFEENYTKGNISEEENKTNGSLPVKTIIEKNKNNLVREENTGVATITIENVSKKKDDPLYVPAAGNIQITSISLSKDPCDMDETETITVRFNEVGGAAVSGRKIEYYLSYDNSFSMGDYYIGNDYVYLSAYEQNDYETIDFVPKNISGLSPGDYYVIIYIQEESEQTYRIDKLTLNATANVECTTLSISQNPVKANQSVELTVNVVEVNGASVSGRKIVWKVQNRSTLSVTELGNDYVYLSAHGSGSESISFAPQDKNLNPGSYLIMVEIPDEGDVFGWPYTNSYLTVEAAVNADLQLSGYNFSINPCPLNESITVTSTINEVGGQAVSGRRIDYYLSTNSIITSSNDLYIGYDLVNLSANSTGTESITFKPKDISGIVVGDYYFGVIIPDESEYYSSSTLLTISNEVTANLEIPAIALSKDPCALNEQETITIDVREAGGQAVSSRKIEYYLSTDIYYSTGDYHIGDDYVSLSANALSSESISFYPNNISGLSARDYYVIVRIPDEDENWRRTDPLTLTQSAGTMSITSITVNKTSLNMDDDLRITANVSETSGGPVSGSEIQYYLSTNTTISSSDFLLGNDDVNLSANSSGNEYILFKPQNINGLTTGTYYIGIKSVDQLQTWTSNYTIEIHSVGTSIKEICDYALSQNYPNPFNPSTTISYDLPEHSDVSLKIFDLNSKEVFSMEDELDAGHYDLMFDPSAYGLSTGIYIYTLQAGDFIETRKMAYMK